MNPKPNPPDKHHYIPKFHLRRWTNDSGELWRYSKPRNDVTSQRVTVGGVAFERGLYTRQGEQPEDEIRLETRFFGKVDYFAARSFQRLVANEELSEQEVEWFVVYVRSLMHRTPERLKKFEAKAKMYLDDSRSHLQDGLLEIENEKEPNSFDDDRLIMNTLPKMILDPTIISFITAFHWTNVDVTSAEIRLVISDNPVIHTKSLATELGHIAVPISPTLIRIGAPKVQTIDTILKFTPSELVKTMNLQMVCGASRFVATTDKSLDSFIKKHFAAKVIPSNL
jgi:hypothetical protein